MVDGLVTLPADAATVEAFDWLAEEVVEAGGEAWTWRAHPGSKAQHAALRAHVSAAVAAEYRALIDATKEVAAGPTRRAVERLRKDLRGIETRDRFGFKERDQARRAVRRLSEAVERSDPAVAR